MGARPSAVFEASAHRLSCSALFVACLLSATASAQPVHLVADLSPGLEDNGTSSAFGFNEVAGTFYFNARDERYGSELWRTDGTAAGTWRVANLCPGSCGSYPVALTAYRGALYFVAIDGASFGLWRSDGTDAGTALVRHLCAGPCLHEVPAMVVFKDRLYLIPGEGGLWRSDGTAAGTELLATFAVVPYPSARRELTAVGGRLYFAAEDEAGVELWASDGTAAGTARLKDICPGCDANPRLLTGAGDELYFVAFEPEHGNELWKTDGTAAGTRLAADFVPGPAEGGILKLASFAGVVYALFALCPEGRCAWRTDGTAAGTVPATELEPPGSGYAEDLIPVGDTLYFSVRASEAQGVQDLWALSGEPPVAHRVKGGLGSIFAATRFGDAILFGELDGALTRLWISGGTEASTQVLRDDDPEFLLIETSDGRAFFSGGADPPRGEPWITDGTRAGTVPLGDLAPAAPRSPILGPPAVLEDRLYFGFSGNVSYASWTTGLWTSDGSAAGTRAVFENAEIFELTRLGDRLVGFADASGLFVSDGSRDGTSVVSSVNGFGLTAAGGRAFFGADGQFSQQLWTTDGTAAGTVMLADLNPEWYCPFPTACSFGPYPRNLTAVGSTLFLVGFRIGEGQLWKSDGTPEGTVAVRSFAVDAFPETDPLGHLTAFGPGVLFTAFEEGSGREPWWSDGTPGGTFRLADLAPGAASSSVRAITVAGGAAYFLAGEPGVDERLWRVASGSLALSLVHDFAADPGSFAGGMAALGDRLFLTVVRPDTGGEPWVSDGTPAGTHLLVDLFPGPRGSVPHSFTAVDGRLLFAADDGEHGLEPWVTDGTAAGTRLLADVVPGPAPSSPEKFIAAGPWVYFVADDGEHGRELWVADRGFVASGGSGTCVADATTLCLGGNRFAVRVNWSTQFDTSGPGRVVPVRSDDSGLFWFFDPDNWEVLVKVLDGCPVNDRYWVFFAATTDVGFDLTVTDTLSGETLPYTNPLGHRADAVTDTGAFAGCP